MAQKDMPAARERRLRRIAARKGLTVRKLERGKERGRYQLLDPEFGTARTSPSREHRQSFSLEEAERYVKET
jgi:16S rRNA U516 pseudouridylate synthase RsuA-like enzyme